MNGRVRVLYIYADKDAALGRTLKKHLKSLELEGVIESWHPGLLVGGDVVGEQFTAQVAQVQVVLLLLSADFMTSKSCHDRLAQVQAERAARQLQVVPILARPVVWQGLELQDLQPLPRNGQAITLRRNRDAAWVEVVQGLRQLVAAVALGARTASGIVSQPALIWNIPEPSPYFTGRDAEVAMLREALSTGCWAAIGQIQAVSGLGGIGKTQLALEFARRHKEDYEAAFFVRADSELSLHAGLAEMENLLGLPADPEPADLVRTIRRWLESQPRGLLILDSVDDADDIKRVRPLCLPGTKAHILVTTRASDASMIGVTRPVRMEKLRPDESERFLLDRTGQPKLEPGERAALQQVADELGHLPLALEQAGAYIVARQMRFAGYLSAFRHRRSKLLREPSPLDDRHPVATTWALNMQEIRATAPASAALLELSSFLAPDGIPEELLIEGAEELGPELGPSGEMVWPSRARNQPRILAICCLTSAISDQVLVALVGGLPPPVDLHPFLYSRFEREDET